MLFNSFHFLVFFPLVTLGYFLLPHRARVLWLLAASCWFYMAFIPKYLTILAFTIVVDYCAGILIARAQGAARKRYLAWSILTNCSVLAAFKYFDFFSVNISALAGAIHWNYTPVLLSWILPIGLSFHTFQAMSYTIEVYRGNQQPERRFLHFALYVMFYPQLVAGPIERPQKLLPQFDEIHSFDYRQVTGGLKLMAWGFFQKVVIADRLAVTVNMVYDHPESHGGFAVLIAMWCFAFQILCDFSGYTDIARGAAQVMGFRLMVNFAQPYWASSIQDLWRRWHISLYTWFRDYLYFSLGGRRISLWRRVAAVMVVFFVVGLWHGANWTYLVWGGMHGVATVVVLLWAGSGRRAPKHQNAGGFLDRPWLSTFFTFQYACVSMIFFRAPSVQHAFHSIGQFRNVLSPGLAAAFINEAGVWRLGVAGALIASYQAVQLFQEKGSLIEVLNRQPGWLRWSVYFLGLMTIVAAGEFDSAQRFIYFQY